MNAHHRDWQGSGRSDRQLQPHQQAGDPGQSFHFNNAAPVISFLLMMVFAGLLMATEVIQPKLYPAQDQSHVLAIEPFSPDGLNGAAYTLRTNAQTLWQKQLTFTAVKANVTTTGAVMICGYSQGLNPSRLRPNKADVNYLEVQLFDPSGQLRWSWSAKREVALRIHGADTPLCEELLVLPEVGQAYIWFDHQQRLQALQVDMQTGASRPHSNAAMTVANRETSVERMRFHRVGPAGWKLAEVTGWIYEDNESGNGANGYLSDALYYLLDADGQVRWQKLLKSSLDLRGKLDGEQLSAAYQIRDLYLRQHDLAHWDEVKQQLSITDYRAGLSHRFQLTADGQVKARGTAPLNLPFTPWQQAVANETSPVMIRSVDLKAATSTDCSWAAMEVLSNGDVLLFDDQQKRISKISAAEVDPGFIVVPPGDITEELITEALLFVNHQDEIYLNLGDQQFAVFNASGARIDTVKLSGGCDRLCVSNIVAHKQAPMFWAENGSAGTSLMSFPLSSEVLSQSLNDSRGYWYEYISFIQADPTGRLLMIGRLAEGASQAYVLDQQGQPVTSFALGPGHIRSATLAGEVIYLSRYGSGEIAVVDFSGQLIQRFTTANQQAPEWLRAGPDQLYVVTRDALLIYDINEYNDMP